MLHGSAAAPTARMPYGVPENKRSAPKWIPFVAVAAVCAVVVAFAFAGATSQNASPVTASSSSSAASSASSETSSTASPSASSDETDRDKELEEAQERAAAAEAAAKEAEAKAQAEAEARAKAEAEAAAVAAQQASASVDEGFWGVWIGAFRVESNAQDYVNQARAEGFDAEMFISTDWENLNHAESFYVVSAGRYASQSAADAVLPSVQQAGFSDAYVKYSGNRE